MRKIFFGLFLGLSTLPGHALDIDFNGTVVSTCSLALGTDGVMTLSSTGTVMGSEIGLGLPGTVLILSIGTNTINVDAPVHAITPPVGYDDSDEELEVSYFGADGLSLILQDYTTADTSFAVGSIPLSVLTLNNRITNSAGFVEGNYSTRTVVTCN